MVYAALDIHKSVFQGAVLDLESGTLGERRFPASQQALEEWAAPYGGRLAAVAVEATSGWRWVVARLQALGFQVQLVDPGRASALKGRRRGPKTDRLDARWLVELLARELAPESWIPPEEIQRLRDRTRLRKTLADERRRLLTQQGRRWVDGLALEPGARACVETALAMIAACEGQLEPLERELTRFAR